MFLFDWGFRANKLLKFSDASVEVNDPSSGEPLPLSKLVSNLPVLQEKKLTLHPLLFNGVLQSMYYGSATSEDKYRVWYGREVFKYNDGGICSLDWVKEPDSSAEIFKQKYRATLPEGWPKLLPRTRFFDEEELAALHKRDEVSVKPIVVVLHGLAGGSHEPLVRSFAESLTTGKNKNKYDVVISLARGCGRTKITNEKLYNAIAVEDVHDVIVEMKTRYPKRPLYVVGFSFGAVLLTNYLGLYAEEASKYVKGASIVGCPFDLERSINGMQKSWSGAYLFDPAVASFLHKLVKNNFKELHQYNPELYSKENLAKTATFKASKDFDNLLTCKTANFDTADDYYRKCSPVINLPQIKVPFLSIASWDDPTAGKYIPTEIFQKNPYTVSLELDLGGHLAFITPQREFWAIKVVEEYFEALEGTL